MLMPCLCLCAIAMHIASLILILYIKKQLKNDLKVLF